MAASTLAADCPNAGAAASIALTDGPTLLARELALDAALSADDETPTRWSPPSPAR